MDIKDHHYNTSKSSGWHSCWEENVYRLNHQLNMYPFDAVVSFIYKNCKSIDHRSRMKILELGFGAGNNLWFMAREGFTVAGVEGSKSAVKFAKQRFQRNSLNGDLRLGDFSQLPWEDDTFDIIIDRGSLTCNTSDTIKSALMESKRVLKKNGKLLSVLLFSDLHPEREFGEKIDKNTYDNFRKGYFKGLGRTHFATFDEIKELYGKLFQIVSLVHILEENYLVCPKKPVNAYWKIECENK